MKSFKISQTFRVKSTAENCLIAMSIGVTDWLILGFLFQVCIVYYIYTGQFL